MRYSKKDYEENQGRTVYGRVLKYSYKDGYGFIYTENKKDIMFSSYEITKRDERKVCLGSLVRFIPKIYNNKVVAGSLEFINFYPDGIYFILPNGERKLSKQIMEFGVIKGNETAQKLRKSNILVTDEILRENGMELDDLTYLYIVTTVGEYRFFDNSSRLHGDGNICIEKYREYLWKTFLEV